MDNTKRNLLALSLVLPSMAQAFGLGEITVHSRLGEPLRAEIAVTDPSGVDDKLKLALAGKDDFYRVGLELTPYLSGLQFRLVEQDDGGQVIEVSTRAAAREPFLSFLLEANWSSGRMLKEYTLLLDPPVFDTASSRPASSQPAQSRQEPVQDTRITREAAEPEMAQPVEPVSASEPEPVMEEPAVESYGSSVSEYVVRAGDTLWEVARDLRPDAGIDVNTMMMALLESNPDAFIDNNINGLKRGAVLRVPDRPEIESMGLEDALQLVREQNALWQQYRGQMAEEPATISDATAYEDSSDAGMDGGAADAELRLVPPAGEDESRASVNAAGTASSEDVAILEDELNRTREELATKEQETAELASRVSELESLVDKLERAINIKDADLAALQAELEAARAAMEEAGDTAVGEDAMPVESMEDTETAPAEEDMAGEETMPLDEDTAALVEGSETDDATDEPAADEFSLADDMATEPAPIEEDALVDEGMEQPAEAMPLDEAPAESVEEAEPSEPAAETPPMTLGGDEEPESGLFGLSWTVLGAIGGGVLLLLILLMLKKRSGKEEEETESELPPEAPPSAEEIPVETEEETAETESGPEEDSDRTETETVEPVIALDDEEEPDLGSLGLEDEDEDVDLSDIYEGSDVDHPELENEESADDLGLDNLFDEDTESQPLAEESSTSTEDDFDFDLDLDEEPQADTSADMEADSGAPAVEESTEDALEFDLGDTAGEATDETDLASDSDEEFSLDFDLDEESDTGEEESPVAADEQAEGDDEPVEFDLDLDDTPELEMESGEAEGETQPAEMDTELELDTDAGEESDMFDDEDAEEELDIPTDDLFEDEDAVATKLDLARAYLDMGDPDGARTMLEEVVQEGNDEQKSQAQELLDGMN